MSCSEMWDMVAWGGRGGFEFVGVGCRGEDWRICCFGTRGGGGCGFEAVDGDDPGGGA